jgi:hypothetical protein
VVAVVVALVLSVETLEQTEALEAPERHLQFQEHPQLTLAEVGAAGKVEPLVQVGPVAVEMVEAPALMERLILEVVVVVEVIRPQKEQAAMVAQV